MVTSRILLAAPDLRAVATHQAFLMHQGYDVTVCKDGLDCADRLRREVPDVLVLALDLPWGRGEGVLALMADGELPAVPVVLLADHSAPARLSDSGRYPVRSFLSWPAPPRLLSQAVRGVLADVPFGRPSAEIDAGADEWAAAPLRPLS
jgi:DNA-binding NtrC family response regulator